MNDTGKQQDALEPRLVRPDDLDPRIDWNRPIQAPGHMGVDFETRVDFRRLHRYRLAARDKPSKTRSVVHYCCLM